MNTWLKLERCPDNDLPLPSIATSGSAGIDFSACLTRPCTNFSNGTKTQFIPDCKSLYLHPGETIGIPLGFKAQFDKTYALLLFLRSSSGLKGLMLANLVGVIDSDYRGELMALLINRTDSHILISHGDRIVQGLMFPTHQVLISEGEVDDTTRGDGGMGSTGA